MTIKTNVTRLGCPALHTIYKLIEEVRSDELQAAHRLVNEKRGSKVALTRVRVKLSQISNLCKIARKEILVMTKGTDEVDEMEKYGVAENAELVKRGDTVELCSRCGKPVERHGDVLKCPVCGTEPFEA